MDEDGEAISSETKVKEICDRGFKLFVFLVVLPAKMGCTGQRRPRSDTKSERTANTMFLVALNIGLLLRCFLHLSICALLGSPSRASHAVPFYFNVEPSCLFFLACFEVLCGSIWQRLEHSLSFFSLVEGSWRGETMVLSRPKQKRFFFICRSIGGLHKKSARLHSTSL